MNGEGELCPGVGYEIEEIDAKINMSMKFNECYKTIITDLCDFSTSWKGYDSLWLDQCSLSSDSLIDLADFVLLEKR